MTAAATAPRRPLFSLEGKVALVTGASRGIGEACALLLARQGADVAVNYVHNEVEASAVADRVRKLGRRAMTARADVSRKPEVDAMVDAVTEELGPVDVLVNNAGVLSFEPFLDLKEETWDRVLDVNLKGQFLVAQAVARDMVKGRRKGRIVNVASIGSGGVGVGAVSASHYVASKGGVVALTETMALELAPHGVLVNAVAPGLVETDMVRSLVDDPAQRQASSARIPLARPGEPGEVAAVVAFLASGEASYCTGSVFYVDGGYLSE